MSNKDKQQKEELEKYKQPFQLSTIAFVVLFNIAFHLFFFDSRFSLIISLICTFVIPLILMMLYSTINPPKKDQTEVKYLKDNIFQDYQSTHIIISVIFLGLSLMIYSHNSETVTIPYYISFAMFVSIFPALLKRVASDNENVVELYTINELIIMCLSLGIGFITACFGILFYVKDVNLF
jgi:hypothetical protein